MTALRQWNDLSIPEKAEMMKVAIRNGITDLKTIKQKYNEFAEGGPTSDDDLVDWIIKEEGFNSKPEDIGDGKMTLGSGLTAQKWHDLYKQRGNKWSAADNRNAVAQEVAARRKWAEENVPNWDTLPESSQKALLSYKYNYDFNKDNSPKLFKALADSDLYEAARQMDATSKDPKFKKGLMNRRKREQAWFLSDVALPMKEPQMYPIEEQPVSTAVYSPYPTKIANTTVAYKMVPDEGNYVKAHRLTEDEARWEELSEKWDAINKFNTLMNMINVQNNPLEPFTSTNPILAGIGTMSNAEGGKIHIDPSKKGTFTAAASKHGMGVQEFASKVLAHPENYSPAMRKKANFARNAAKWHGEGGNLFEDGGFWNTVDRYANGAEKALSIGSLAATGATIAAPNPYTLAAAYAANVGSGIVDGYQGVRAALKGDYGNALKNAGELLLSISGAKLLKDAQKLSKLDDALRTSGATREYITRTVGRRAATKHTYKMTKEAAKAKDKNAVGFALSTGANASSMGDIPTKAFGGPLIENANLYGFGD